MWRWIGRMAGGVVALAAAFAIGGAVSAMSRLPDLQPWHQLVSKLEPRASEMTETFGLDDYLRREDAVFREAQARMDATVGRGADPALPNRYVAASRSAPGRFPVDFNRTQVQVPAQVRGGALLVHGLTDSPYSMRTVASRLHDAGYYTLSLRMQGHGTVPGGLVKVIWEDWVAAVRMGVRHVRSQIGPGMPLVLVGYSNGGALVTEYALQALDDARVPAPTRLILLSPMIGVSPMARLARMISLLGPVPFFEKARWLDVLPEYNPFKYNSFPANAAIQTARFTRAIQDHLSRLGSTGALGKFPPVLAFQSVVDTTVSTPAVVTDLFDRLPARGHELVLFDLNRQSGVDALTRPGAVLPRLTSDGVRPYAVTLVTNRSPDTPMVSAMTVAAGTANLVAEPLDLAWPQDMFSLSHVALTFPPDDSLYGGMSTARERGGLALGRVIPRGEKDVLIVPLDSLMRVSWNPFFPYLASRIERWVAF